MGRKADAIRPGVHRHDYAAHVILYEPAEGGVLILAIIHGRSVRGLDL
ncbi:toxin ParE1/3/4 [Methylobacterium phyllostachyos]|uniref:Toxin ParE1/3/4 n=1 Tax=Methylobacterium phyllostachyos TaxID=582672 RepID=A0A1H0DC88_9HYPH|nr:toxin ParE1/3/4 [Methylobacterium phyllostachyos]